MNNSNAIINLLTIVTMLLLPTLAALIVRNTSIVQQIITYLFNIPYLNLSSILISAFTYFGFPMIRGYIINIVKMLHLESYFKPNHDYVSYLLSIPEMDMKKFIGPTDAITVVSALLTAMFSANFIINEEKRIFPIFQQDVTIFLNKYLGFFDILSNMTLIVFVAFIVAHLAYIIAWVVIALYLKLKV
ncbi:MAG: hypothetical protein K0U39_09155 [Alphaproteobacteria bacterium]|nr:hypothetical protein [Alphaproteobacteria bacterium]